MALLSDPSDPTFIYDPVSWIGLHVFGYQSDFAKKWEVHKNTPQATGSNQFLQPVKTTTVIGYVLLAGVTIYFARKVLD